jgi:hypothetical protein
VPEGWKEIIEEIKKKECEVRRKRKFIHKWDQPSSAIQ